MAAFAGSRSGFFSGPLFLLVTFGAQRVHDLHFFQFAGSLHGIDRTGLLRKKAVADIAVVQVCLVHSVRKRNVSVSSAGKKDLLGASVFFRIAEHHCTLGKKQQGGNAPQQQPFGFHLDISVHFRKLPQNAFF